MRKFENESDLFASDREFEERVTANLRAVAEDCCSAIRQRLANQVGQGQGDGGGPLTSMASEVADAVLDVQMRLDEVIRREVRRGFEASLDGESLASSESLAQELEGFSNQVHLAKSRLRDRVGGLFQAELRAVRDVVAQSLADSFDRALDAPSDELFREVWKSGIDRAIPVGANGSSIEEEPGNESVEAEAAEIANVADEDDIVSAEDDREEGEEREAGVPVGANADVA